MRRTNWKTVSTLITMATIAGCSEGVVSPSAATPSAATASVAVAPAGRPALNVTLSSQVSTATDFTVGPNGGVYVVGSNAVIFPASSICDPSTSSYGLGTWDDSCAPLTHSITVHAVTRVADGLTQVDFSPSLRFVPSANPARWVWLYMNVPSLAGKSDLSRYTILYAPTLNGPLVNESLSDSTLRTYVDTHAGVSLRRVKHFSGYAVTQNNCEDKGDGTVSITCPPPAPPAPTP